MEFTLRDILKTILLFIGISSIFQCTNVGDKKIKQKNPELKVLNKLNSEYYFLLKDENGIPNDKGLVLMHSEKDSIYIDPKFITDLDLTPIWDRRSFPIEILNFPNVKNLYIGMRSFESMPEEISQLSQLETIDIQNSNFKYLPKNIGDLGELKELILLFSDVEELPLSICNLQKLEYLHLGGTKIKKLPRCLIHLGQLEKLIIFYETGEFSKELKKQLEFLKSNMPNCEFYIE